MMDEVIEVKSMYGENGYEFRQLKGGDILITKNNINFRIGCEDLPLVSLILLKIYSGKIIFNNNIHGE